MKWKVTDAEMAFSQENGYLGRVRFTLEGHRSGYEMTLHSKNGKEWSYSLNFAGESGPEEEIEAAEEQLEENDELFDELVEAAKSKLKA